MDFPANLRSLPPVWRWVVGVAVVVLVAFLSFSFSSYLSAQVSPTARGRVRVQVRPQRVETGEAVLVRWKRRYFQSPAVNLAICRGRGFQTCAAILSNTTNDGRETVPVTVAPGTYAIRVGSPGVQSVQSNRFRVVPEERDDEDGGGGGGGNGGGGGGGGGAPPPPPPPPPPHGHGGR